jgi:BlaI family transcriptional regulator, penicillinase repressor
VPKNQDLPVLSEAQLEIMHVIWQHGECSVATVWKTLHERRGISRNTVHTLIVRLEEKGWLVHSAAAGGFLYRATIPREQAQRGTVEKMVRTVFNGSAEGLVLALLEGDSLSKSEAARIRQLIGKAKTRKP